MENYTLLLLSKRAFQLKLNTITNVIFFILILFISETGVNASQISAEENFEKIVIDKNGPVAPWGKSIGDINGDGKPDLIIGGHTPRGLGIMDRIFNKLHLKKTEWPKYGELVWYENPGWQKRYISKSENFRTDHEVADIDGDGKNDVISLADSGLIWYKNPDWQKFVIDTKRFHDIEIADFDKDGDIDIIARNQRLFGYDDANIIHFYRQDDPYKWYHFQFSVPNGEGLAVGDMDGDNFQDVVVNGKWYKNPGTLEVGNPWQDFVYCPSWKWLDVFIDLADINGDGKLDVALSPAEPAGHFYHISWCEAPEKGKTDWVEHIVDPRVESVLHSIRAGDFNNDNLVDIVVAEMVQGADPDEVNIYWQQENNTWQKQTVSLAGSHSMRIVDFDADGDLDFFGANWSGGYEGVELWVNKKKIAQTNGKDM